MKIKLYWPKCDYLNKQWIATGVDSYWVECTYEEAERKIFPHLSSGQIEDSKKNWEPKEEGARDIGIDIDRLCYLVSKDMQSIESFPWYYPYSGHWNAYCPFEAIKEIEIVELDELRNLNFDINN